MKQLRFLLFISYFSGLISVNLPEPFNIIVEYRKIDYEISVLPDSTLEEIKHKTLRKHLESSNYNADLLELSNDLTLWVYYLGEPLHKPNASRKICHLFEYEELKYLLYANQ